MSCDDSLPSYTSSNTHTSPKASKSSKSFTNYSSNKDPNDFHAVSYSYPQGSPLKETQANLHLTANTFNNAKPKEPKPSYNIMDTLARPSPSLLKSSIQFQHASFSLEVATCKEDSKNDKEKNIKKDQDQKSSMSYNYFHNVSDPFHGPFDSPCYSSFIPQGLTPSLKQDKATTYTVELIENQNDLNTIAHSRYYISIKVIKNSVVTSNVEPI